MDGKQSTRFRQTLISWLRFLAEAAGSVLQSLIGTVLLTRHYGEIGVTISTVVVTLLVLTFGITEEELLIIVEEAQMEGSSKQSYE